MRGFRYLYLLLLSVFLCLLPLYGQIHGIPSSVTSYGFGGNINPAPGVPASVTSLGPNGYSFFPPVNGPCCFNSFFPRHQYSSFPGDQFGRHSRHHQNHFAPLFAPAYAVPYPYPVAVPEAYGDDQDENDYAADDPPVIERRHPRARKDDAEDLAEAAPRQADSEPAEETVVASQPTTVLVFKDGHKLDVENYAIVGGTLFEFTDGLTHKFQLADLDMPATQKVNDDRGVEFHAPSNGAQ